MTEAVFAHVDESAWPVIVIQYQHANPSKQEASAYFATLAKALNDRATQAQPCAIVFDASGIPLHRVMDMDMSFFQAHNAFNKLYYERFKAVCSGFGIVVKHALFRGLIKTALAFAPPTHPCQDFATARDAIATLSAVRSK